MRDLSQHVAHRRQILIDIGAKVADFRDRKHAFAGNPDRPGRVNCPRSRRKTRGVKPGTLLLRPAHYSKNPCEIIDPRIIVRNLNQTRQQPIKAIREIHVNRVLRRVVVGLAQQPIH